MPSPQFALSCSCSSRRRRCRGFRRRSAHRTPPRRCRNSRARVSRWCRRRRGRVGRTGIDGTVLWGGAGLRFGLWTRGVPAVGIVLGCTGVVGRFVGLRSVGRRVAPAHRVAVRVLRWEVLPVLRCSVVVGLLDVLRGAWSIRVSWGARILRGLRVAGTRAALIVVQSLEASSAATRRSENTENPDGRETGQVPLRGRRPRDVLDASRHLELTLTRRRSRGKAQCGVHACAPATPGARCRMK